MRLTRHSKVDVITNSSTEMYVMEGTDLEEVRQEIIEATRLWIDRQFKENPEYASARGLIDYTPEEFMDSCMDIDWAAPKDIIEEYGFEDYYCGSSKQHICVVGKGDNTIPYDLLDLACYITSYHFG